MHDVVVISLDRAHFYVVSSIKCRTGQTTSTVWSASYHTFRYSEQWA